MHIHLSVQILLKQLLVDLVALDVPSRNPSLDFLQCSTHLLAGSASIHTAFTISFIWEGQETPLTFPDDDIEQFFEAAVPRSRGHCVGEGWGCNCACELRMNHIMRVPNKNMPIPRRQSEVDVWYAPSLSPEIHQLNCPVWFLLIHQDESLQVYVNRETGEKGSSRVCQADVEYNPAVMLGGFHDIVRGLLHSFRQQGEVPQNPHLHSMLLNNCLLLCATHRLSSQHVILAFSMKDIWHPAPLTE